MNYSGYASVVFLAIFALSVVITVIGVVLLLGYFLIAGLISLFVETTPPLEIVETMPPIETSWFLAMFVSLAIGMIYAVVGYLGFRMDPEDQLETVLREGRQPEDDF